MNGETGKKQYLSDRDFVDKIPNGLGIFSYENGKYAAVYLNDGYYRMMHVRREDRSPEIKADPSLAVLEEDRERLNAELSAAARENRPLNCNIRILQGDGSYRWYNLNAVAAERGAERIIWYNSYTDIDDLVRAEGDMEESRRRYELAIKSASLAVWEYEIGTKRLVMPRGINSGFARERYGLTGNTLENVPDSVLHMGLNEAEREKILRLHEEIRSGQEFATADVWFRRTPEEKPECDRISYIVVKDGSGRPVRAYGSGLDITAEKQEQLNFHQAIQTILTANPQALCTFRLNLTQNQCCESHGMSPFIVNTLRSDTLDGLFENCRKLIPDEDDKAAFFAVFERKKLISEFNAGRQSLHVDYRRRDETGKRFWVRTYISMLGNPETGDIEGAIYSLDISREMQQNEIFSIITDREYDLIALLHLDTGMVESVQLSKTLLPEYRSSFAAAGDRCSFDAMRRNGAAGWVVPEDRQKYLEGTEPARIRAELDEKGFYELVVRGLSRDRGRVYRKLQHYYLNPQKDCVLIIDSDVTQTYLGQQKEVERAESEAKRTQDRTNKELALFITCLLDLSKYREEYRFPNVQVFYEPDNLNAVKLARSLSDYTYIGYTPSIYNHSLDFQISENNTHTVIGQEFENVCMIIDDNFSYVENKLIGKTHPNPDYIFEKLLYQGLTRVRSKLAIIITEEETLNRILDMFTRKLN